MKLFTEYGHVGHLGYVNWIFKYIVPPSYRFFMYNLVLIGQTVLEETRFENYSNIHVYCSGVGADEPPASNLFQNH